MKKKNNYMQKILNLIKTKNILNARKKVKFEDKIKK